MRSFALGGSLLLLIALRSACTEPQPINPLTLAELKQGLESNNRGLRYSAIRALGNHGTAAKEVVEDLARILCEDADEPMANQAALALAQIGPTAVPLLDKALKDQRPAVRFRALTAVGLIGPEAKETVPALSAALADPAGDKLRALAAYALGEVRPQEKAAVLGLVRALRDRSPLVRAQVVASLGSFGPEVIPGLQDALLEDQAFVRHDAIQVLGMFGPKAKEAVPALTKALRDKDAKVRLAAINALTAVGGDAREALPVLVESLKEHHLEMQQRALQAIMTIGSATDDPSALLDSLQQVNQRYGWATPYVLRQFGPKAKDAVKPLTKALKDKDAGVRQGSAIALGQIGPEAKEAIPALSECMLRDENAQVRASAAMALVQLDRSKQEEAYKQALRFLDLAQLKGKDAEEAAHAQRLHLEAMRPAQAKIRAAALDLAIEMKGANPAKDFVDDLARQLDPTPLREAFFDPVLQAHYDEIVSSFVNAMAARPPASCSDLTRIQKVTRARVDKLHDPAAIPALVKGLNQIARYKIRFT